MLEKLRLAVGTVACAAMFLTACGDDEVIVEQANPTTVAPVASWQAGPAGLRVPISDEDGPFESTPVPHGFSHTPQGAVLAAITGQVWMAGANDELWPEVAQYLLEPGVGRDQWSQARSLVSVSGTVDKSADFRGYKFTEYGDRHAVVVIASQWPDGTLTAYPVQVSHSTGQWRIVIPPQDQTVDMEIIAEDALSDFVVFSSQPQLTRQD